MDVNNKVARAIIDNTKEHRFTRIGVGTLDKYFLVAVDMNCSDEFKSDMLAANEITLYHRDALDTVYVVTDIISCEANIVEGNFCGFIENCLVFYIEGTKGW